MAMGKKSFACLHKKFELSESTLPAMCLLSGLYTLRRIHCRKSGELERLQIVVKVPQMVKVGNYILSLCHYIKSGWTVAFLCGHDVVNDSNYKDYKSYGAHLDPIIALLESIDTLWDHPLMLPTVLLGNYQKRLYKRVEDLEIELSEVENALGVTGGARSMVNEDLLKDWPEGINIKLVTVSLHSTATGITFVSAVCAWAQECAYWLDKVNLDEAIGGLALQNDISQVNETIAFLRSSIVSNSRFTECMKERAQFQTNLVSLVMPLLKALIENESQLYTAMSQRDVIEARKYSAIAQQQNQIALQGNKVSLELAKATKVDGIVMVTFTIISAVFLPGTYISSLFSMSMFNWQIGAASSATATSDRSSSPGHVSKWFWIYWVVSVPLTVLILLGWRLGYVRGKKAWGEQVERMLAESEVEAGEASSALLHSEKLRHRFEACPVSQPRNPCHNRPLLDDITVNDDFGGGNRMAMIHRAQKRSAGRTRPSQTDEMLIFPPPSSEHIGSLQVNDTDGDDWPTRAAGKIEAGATRVSDAARATSAAPLYFSKGLNVTGTKYWRGS